MATYVKGNPVENATSYELFEKVGSAYNSLKTGSEINFDVSALGLSGGNHTLVVKAKADGYEDSDYSNEVVYAVESDINPVINEIFNNMAWTVGRAPTNGSVGLTTDDVRYVCMNVPYNTNGETIVINNPKADEYCLLKSVCDGDGKQLEFNKDDLNSATWTVNGNIRLCIKFADNRDITEALWQTIKAEILAAN